MIAKVSHKHMNNNKINYSRKFIVTGDATQVDLPRREDSGLLRGISLLRNIKGVSTIYFSNEDIVRHPLVSKIVKAFDRKETEDTAETVGAAETTRTAGTTGTAEAVWTSGTAGTLEDNDGQNRQG